jgi:hypothetical protein
MFVHPILLLGRAQPYPEHVRSGSLYQSHRFSVLSWGQLPERRRVSPRYSDAMLAVKHFGKVFGNTWCAAVEEVFELGPRIAAKRLHQLRSVDPTRQCMSVPATEPYQRHAVRHDKICSIKDAAEIGIPARLHDAVHPSNGYAMDRSALLNPMLHSSGDIGNLDGTYANGQNPEVRRRLF